MEFLAVKTNCSRFLPRRVAGRTTRRHTKVFLRKSSDAAINDQTDRRGRRRKSCSRRSGAHSHGQPAILWTVVLLLRISSPLVRKSAHRSKRVSAAAVDWHALRVASLWRSETYFGAIQISVCLPARACLRNYRRRTFSASFLENR